MVPSCVYSLPEIARVGLTEEGAREVSSDVTVGTGRLGANGKALAMGETLGFVAWWSTALDRLVGATIMGPHATDLIHELGLALVAGIPAREVGLMIHAHPTVAEAVMDAAHEVHDVGLYADEIGGRHRRDGGAGHRPGRGLGAAGAPSVLAKLPAGADARATSPATRG